MDMKKDTIDFELPAETPDDMPRDCHMSQELFQNASLTMGELRDFIRESGVSWDFISAQIEQSQHAPSPLQRALNRIDEYSTGIANSLENKPSNVW